MALQYPSQDTPPPPRQIMSPHAYGAPSVWHAFLRGFQLGPSNPSIGVRRTLGTKGPFEYYTYAHLDQSIRLFLHGLHVLGFCKSQGERIGLSGDNTFEWIVAYLAIIRSSNVPFLIPPTNSSSSSNLTFEPSFVLPTLYIVPVKSLYYYSNAPSLDSNSADNNVPSTFILLDGEEYDLEDTTFDVGPEARVYTFGEVERLGLSWIGQGQGDSEEIQVPRAEEIAEVAFTCSEDGCSLRPIELTHRQLATSIACLHEFSSLSTFVPLSKQVYLFPLPLYHLYSRLVLLYALYTSSSIALSNFSALPGELLEDLDQVKPTVLATVPGVLDGLLDKLNEHPPTLLGPSLFSTAISQKLTLLQSGHGSKNAIWDALLFSHFTKLVGSKLTHIISSGATLNPETRDLLSIYLGVKIHDLYTVTVAGGVVALDGSVSKGVEVQAKEEDLEEGDMSEIKVRTWEGWEKTGDGGQWTDDGRLKLMGRIREHFKPSLSLAYVHPPSIEAALEPNLFEVIALRVVGSPCEPYLTILAHVDRSGFKQWVTEQMMENNDQMTRSEDGNLIEWEVESSKSKSMQELTPSEVTLDEEMERMWCERVRSVGKNVGLRGVQLPRQAKLGFDRLPEL